MKGASLLDEDSIKPAEVRLELWRVLRKSFLFCLVSKKKLTEGTQALFNKYEVSAN